MQKQVLRKNIGKIKFNAESYSITYPNINEIIEFFIEAKEAGATHVDWYAKSDYGESEYCQAQPFYEIEETDEELERRLKNEAAKIKHQLAESERREKSEYERLKAKFE